MESQQSPPAPQDLLVTPEQLCVGLFVHIDLPWFSHPFSFNSFQIRNAEQIASLRKLGVQHFRYDPARSTAQPKVPDGQPLPAAPEPSPELNPAQEAALAHKRERIADMAQRRRRLSEVEQAFLKSAEVMRNINTQLFARPKECLEEATELISQVAIAFLDQPEISLHVMNDHSGREETYYHGLNCSILSLMLARELGINRIDCQLMGLGALLHDIGLADIPDRIARARHELSTHERRLREAHCEFGVRLARQIALPESIQRIIMQHHEMADGSGYPAALKGAQMDRLARVVSLVNYYDNLCNPIDINKSLTPHEALSLMFAQRRSKFDAQALQIMIRCLGVYPPGTVVRLSNDTIALVTSINPAKPLRPWVTVFDPGVPKDEAIMLDLEKETEVNITKALRPSQLAPEVYEYLSPRKRVSYYFDPNPQKGRKA